MTKTRKPRPVAAIALAVAAIAALPALAGDPQAAEHKTIRIKKLVHDCEGEGCDEMKRHRRAVVIRDHGGAHAFSLHHHGKGGFLGVATSELTRELRQHFGVPEDAGVLVAKVVADSAAANAGLLVGDILTAVDGEPIDSSGDLIGAIHGLEPGAAVDLELYRDGTLLTLGATLGERRMAGPHAMVVHCAGGREDCPEIAARDLDCGDDSDCEVEIVCKDGSCDCTVNGEPTECETLHGLAAPGE